MSAIVHTADVPVGRLTGKVRVFANGVVRFTVPFISNFYSYDDEFTDLERKQIRTMRRAVVHELIEALERRALDNTKEPNR